MQRLPFEMTAAHAGRQVHLQTGSHNGRQVHLQTGLPVGRALSRATTSPILFYGGDQRHLSGQHSCTRTQARKTQDKYTNTQHTSPRPKQWSLAALQRARRGGVYGRNEKVAVAHFKGQQCWPSQRMKTNAHKVAGPGQCLRPTPGWLAACARHEWWKP